MRPYSDPAPEPYAPLSLVREMAAEITAAARPLMARLASKHADPAAESEAGVLAQRMATLAVCAEPSARPQLEHAAWVLGMLRDSYSQRAANQQRRRRVRRKVRIARRVRPLARRRGAGRPRALRRIARRASCRGPDSDDDGPAHQPPTGPLVWWRRRP
jgi:hypothetical protein